MNYLGHALLSFGDAALLTGNMIGDHVKGKLVPGRFPEGILKGLALHRSIDSFTDAHAAAIRARVWFRQEYGLYSGAIVDSLFDHFLANDARYFPSENDLLQFSRETYRLLESQSVHFPDTFAAYFPYMREQNWLYGYRMLPGMRRSLEGLARRAQYMPPPQVAYETFVSHYYQLNQCYYEFIDDVATFVKNQLNR